MRSLRVSCIGFIYSFKSLKRVYELQELNATTTRESSGGFSEKAGVISVQRRDNSQINQLKYSSNQPACQNILPQDARTATLVLAHKLEQTLLEVKPAKLQILSQNVTYLIMLPGVFSLIVPILLLIYTEIFTQTPKTKKA